MEDQTKRDATAGEGSALPPSQGHGHEDSVRSLRTLKGDVEDAVREERASVVSIAAAESERRAATGVSLVDEPQRSPWRKIAIGSGVAFILLGAAVLASIFIERGDTSTKNVEVPYFFSTEAKSSLDATGLSQRELLSRLSGEKKATRLSLGSIRQLYLIRTAAKGGTELLPAPAFLESLDAHVPAALARVAAPLFLLGVHVFDGNQPFLMVSVDPYEQAFAAMLEWEPYLLADLSPLFPSSADGEILAYRDEVIDNKDVRVARTTGGKAVALYSFLDRRTLLITTNESTLREVVSRLTRPRI